MMTQRHPAHDMPAPKGYVCPACQHSTAMHREHGCDIGSCECSQPFGRIMPADPPPAPLAADLPESSVVAGRYTAWVKLPRSSDDESPWRGTEGGRVANSIVQRAMNDDGAEVLRYGNGQEG